VSRDVIETVAYRTPSFRGWQQEQWWTHCKDAAQFLGPVGRTELEAMGAAALAFLRNDPWVPFSWDKFVSILDKDRGPTGYLFRCTHCGQLGGYWDCH
jgi:uncharacterized protein CbrC (UPF0167 family)